MAKLYNLARMTTATTGTGTITLGAAVSGYLAFTAAGVANGDVVDYAIKDGANSEHGTGTYTSAGTTLTRTVTKSTNGNAAINLSGAAEVFISPRAETLNDASVLTTGTIADARQSSNVPLKNAANNVFSGLANFGSGNVPTVPVDVNLSGATALALPVATTGHFRAVNDAAQPSFLGQGFGNNATIFRGATAAGTAAAPTALGADVQVVNLTGIAYHSGGSYTGPIARVAIHTKNAPTPSDYSGYVSIASVAPGTTSAIERARIGDVADSIILANYNTSQTVAPTFTATFHGVGADGVNICNTLDSFGATSQSVIFTRNANGTLAAKSAVASGTILGAWAAQGWSGSVYATGVNIQIRATANWTTTTSGAEVAFRVTPNNSQAPFDHTVCRQDGCLTVGTTSPGGLMGSIIANGGIGAGNVAPTQVGDIRGLSTAKAWLCQNGSGGAILDSFNISSVGYSAFGIYSCTFTTALASANYAASFGVFWGGSAGSGMLPVVTAQNANNLSYRTLDNSFLVQDAGKVMIAMFGR